MHAKHLPGVGQLLLSCHQRRLYPAQRSAQGLCGLALLHIGRGAVICCSPIRTCAGRSRVAFLKVIGHQLQYQV